MRYHPVPMPSVLKIPVNEMTSFDLPKVCVVTGETADVTFQKVKFQWYPRWVAVFSCAPLIAVIVMLVLMKRAEGELPFTAKAYGAYKLAKAMLALAILACIGLILGAVFLLDSSPPLAVVMFVLAIAAPVAISLAFVRGKTVGVTRIDETGITLRIPSEAAAMAIRDHLSGRRQSPPAALQPAS
jgi:hypothetical protein